jgi:hypothetical protein
MASIMIQFSLSLAFLPNELNSFFQTFDFITSKTLFVVNRDPLAAFRAAVSVSLEFEKLVKSIITNHLKIFNKADPVVLSIARVYVF